MNHNLYLDLNIRISAKADKVWDALVNPEKIKLYLYGTKAFSKWKKGSELLFTGEFQGKHYTDKGIILELEAEKMFSYTYWSGFSGSEDKAENYSTIVFELEKAEDGVVLYLRQLGFASVQAKEHSEKAWQSVLQQIKQLVEQG
ncbi:MAG TPA: SRPBCC family protein [Bacteroidia bacterium]|nr:SRPBCC family protein [Bacteroidia bacterium]